MEDKKVEDIYASYNRCLNSIMAKVELNKTVNSEDIVYDLAYCIDYIDVLQKNYEQACLCIYNSIEDVKHLISVIDHKRSVNKTEVEAMLSLYLDRLNNGGTVYEDSNV